MYWSGDGKSSSGISLRDPWGGAHCSGLERSPAPEGWDRNLKDRHRRSSSSLNRAIYSHYKKQRGREKKKPVRFGSVLFCSVPFPAFTKFHFPPNKNRTSISSKPRSFPSFFLYKSRGTLFPVSQIVRLIELESCRQASCSDQSMCNMVSWKCASFPVH